MDFTITFPEESQTALQSNTLLQVYAANTDRPLKITYVVVTMQGVDNLAVPVKFEFIVQTDAGTGGTSVTPVKTSRPDPHNIEATALRKPTGSNWTAEPTATDIVHTEFGHPQGGGVLWTAPKHGILELQGGQRLGVWMPTGPAAAVDMTVTMNCEE
jgi:hypothetical protein